MEPPISWYLPEQEGPAKALWLQIWQTQLRLENMNVKEGDSELDFAANGLNTHTNSVMNGKTDKGASFPNRRRKDNNRPTSRVITRKIPSDVHPWRISGFPYQRGVMG